MKNHDTFTTIYDRILAVPFEFHRGLDEDIYVALTSFLLEVPESNC